VFIKEQKLAS